MPAAAIQVAVAGTQGTMLIILSVFAWAFGAAAKVRLERRRR
jgi:hypothetical protein